MAAGDESWQVHLDELRPGTLIDTWRVVERLGAGGYGAVYKVEHAAQPGDCYALKLALHRRDKRTEREEQLLMGKAVHPNVVRLHASGRWPHPVNGNPYFVMSWVDGLALDTWAEALNPSFRLFAETAGKVALALGALHERGVLHRDLKPAHVILRRSDGEPILIDLGVGSFEGADTLTFSVLPPATPHLLSPEAVTFLRKHHHRPGARYETRPTDDLHALGVLLYRLVTGHYPYSPSLSLDLLYAAIEGGEPPAPAAFNPRVPRALSDLILRLLAKNPRARFQTGQEVHAALAAAVASGPGEAWEASLFEWELVPQAEPVQGAARRVRRPEWPTERMTPPLRQPVRRSFRPHLVFLGLAVASFSAVWGANVMGLGSPTARPAAMSEASRATENKLPAGSHGQEVAQQVVSPETLSTAAPPQAVPTPAVVAVPATHAKDEAPVKKKTAVPPTAPLSKNKPSRLRSATKALCVGATALACASTGTGVGSAQLSRDPAPEPCPPGSEEGMEQLDLRMDTPYDALLPYPPMKPEQAIVTEGMVNNAVLTAFNREEAWLTGRIIFGDQRVFGRFTRARTRSGKLDVPVCLEMVELGTLKKGLPYPSPGDRGSKTIRFNAAMAVWTVEEFR